MSKPTYPPHPRLEALRIRRGLKRSALAKRVGISYQHLYGIETGFNTPAVETLQLIANELGVELSEVVGGEDEGTPTPEGADDAPEARASMATTQADEAQGEVRGAA